MVFGSLGSEDNERKEGKDYEDEADDDSDEQNYKGPIRGVSEDIAASMDMDY